MAPGRVEIPVSAPYPVVIGAGLDLAKVLPETLQNTVIAILTD